MKVATAFSGGLAACEFGFKYEDIEHEVIFACEWDKYASKQYLHFHGEPTSRFYEDIQELDATPYKDKIDLFVFGSPCQDLSLAGKRKGFLGEKSSLFRHGARVLEEMKPKVFIFENVKGLLSSNGGADYKETIDTFQELGYLIAMKVVNAKEQGTAQNRERIFVVGFLNEDDYHKFYFADSVPLDKCLRDYLEDEVDEKYFLSQKMIDGFVFTNNGNKIGYINQDTQASSVFYTDSVSASLCSGTHGYAQGYIEVKSATKSGCEIATQNDNVVVENFRIRRLTPFECFKLQGLRDEDIELINSDTQSYKIAGNGIEVNTMRSILRQLYKPVKSAYSLF